jgi:quercetin dioxygenase-like cupin family protein
VRVLGGSLKFGTDDKTIELSESKMVTLHKGLEHSLEALENCTFLLTIANF